jgi:hypothetical protein
VDVAKWIVGPTCSPQDWDEVPGRCIEKKVSRRLFYGPIRSVIDVRDSLFETMRRRDVGGWPTGRYLPRPWYFVSGGGIRAISSPNRPPVRVTVE